MLMMVAPWDCRSVRTADMAEATGVVSLVAVRLMKPSSTPMRVPVRLRGVRKVV